LSQRGEVGPPVAAATPNILMKPALVATSSWKGRVSNVYPCQSISRDQVRSAHKRIPGARPLQPTPKPFRARRASARGGGSYTPDTCVLGHDVCGDFEPLTPMHGPEGVHASLTWKDRAAMPKTLYWARLTDDKRIDVADPAVIQAKINGSKSVSPKANYSACGVSLWSAELPPLVSRF